MPGGEPPRRSRGGNGPAQSALAPSSPTLFPGPEDVKTCRGSACKFARSCRHGSSRDVRQFGALDVKILCQCLTAGSIPAGPYPPHSLLFPFAAFPAAPPAAAEFRLTPSRPTPMRIALIVITALFAVFSSLDAQRQGREPKRPRLTATADTNDWSSYYMHGLGKFDRNTEEAADAFYWAMRLDPSRGEAYYGRWISLLTTDGRVWDYLAGRRGVANQRDVVQRDSLMLEAEMRSPFLHRALDRRMYDKLFDEAIRGHAWSRQDPYIAGWLDYSMGRMGGAVERWREVAKKNSKSLGIRWEMASAFYLGGTLDSAATHVNHVLTEMRKQEEKHLVYFYRSKAYFEYHLAAVHEKQGDLDRAREAYGRALMEDLAYHHARVRLAGIAMAQGDTATALLEFDQAVQLRGSDGVLRYHYGRALLDAKRAADASEQLAQAVQLEPYFAPGYLYYGVALETSGKAREATQQYRAFLARAPRTLTREQRFAQQRIAELADVPGVSGGEL